MNFLIPTFHLAGGNTVNAMKRRRKYTKDSPLIQRIYQEIVNSVFESCIPRVHIPYLFAIKYKVHSHSITGSIVTNRK